MKMELEGLRRFALLLPNTSRGIVISNVLRDINQLALRLCQSCERPTTIFLGIDQEDHETVSKHQKTVGAFEKSGFLSTSSTFFQSIPPGSVCLYWRVLARKAFNSGCFFFLLIGNDVEIKTSNWQQLIEDAFPSIDDLGCVALNDITFPGFPTFPTYQQQAH